MKSYLEIQVPLSYNSPWFTELRKLLSGLTPKWQTNFFHITMAFLDETPDRMDLRPILQRHLDNVPAFTLTFDKLDAFTTRSGLHIVHLASSRVPDDFVTLTEAIRFDLKSAGAQIDSDFHLHVTLGRINVSNIELSQLQKMITSVALLQFSLTLTDVDYRVFRGRTIYETKLKKVQ